MTVMRWRGCRATAIRHAGLVVLAALCIGSAPSPLAAPQVGIPDRISDQEFWSTIERLSEPEGYFNSDNLVSNEDTFQYVIPDLVKRVPRGSVYVGVGPDQNFTYIAAVEPSVAFIPDVRRGNLRLHLMYKALFALSGTRMEFLSRLFARPVPPGLDDSATVQALMDGFRVVDADRGMFDANLEAVLGYLDRHRRRPLDPDDRAGIAFVLQSFFAAGPDLAFVSNAGFRRARYPAYATLQTATDLDGVARAFLASEALFGRIKRLQARNLVIPVVGDFAGPMTLQAIGAWVRERGGRVAVFYTSNVEQYLFQARTWDRFRRSVAAMPIDAAGTFIRSCFNNCSSPGGSRSVTLLDSIPDLLDAASRDRITSYWDVLLHSRSPMP